MKSSRFGKVKATALLFWHAPKLTKIIVLSLLLGFALLIGWLGFKAVAGVKNVYHAITASSTDARNEQKAQTAGEAVNQSLQSAANNEGQRVVNEQEYKRREPERQRVDNEAESARIQLQQQEQRYVISKKTFRPSTDPLDVRERRAVARARKLYDGPAADKP